MDPTLSSILTAFVLALIPLVVGFIGWAAKQLYSIMKRSLSERELFLLEKAAAMAVLYAEQTGLYASGEEKLNVALDAASKQLLAWGIKVSAEQLRAAIEAAVYQEITSLRVSIADAPPA